MGLMEIIAVSIRTARRFGEIGFLIGALGALLLVAHAVLSDSQAIAKLARIGGPLLIAVGFVLGILYVHWN
jgi:hypothetical protein